MMIYFIIEDLSKHYLQKKFHTLKLVGLHGIISARKAGCQSLSEVADHLDVTESFLQDALLCYKQKYGLYAILDNYVIFFEPVIGVCELNEVVLLGHVKT